ncbi:MAG: hypothetical protein J6X86_06095 [Bacteroidales bacterium]|nr:hypothetical protein [Bacteroidales bacterium]
MTKRIILLALLAATMTLRAQETVPPRQPITLLNSANSSMHMLYDEPPSTLDMRLSENHLLLDIDAAGFFFDAEYATPMAKGYTVTGFRLSPTLVYGINNRAQLRVGLNASLFAGLDSMYRLRPTFSLVYKPSEWLTLVAGTIYGSYSHRLDAPVYDPSRWIYNYQEDGLQILTKTKMWSSDTWLDWSHYLTPWTADQERFTMGSQHVVSFFKYTRTTGEPIRPCCAERKAVHDTMCIDTIVAFIGDCFRPERQSFNIDIPFHFVASHRGGEVKTIDTNTVTTFNERIGVRLQYTSNKKHTHRFTLDLPFYYYQLEDKDLDNGGKGFYPMLTYEFKSIDRNERKGWSLLASAGWWHGDHYFSAYGSPQFWSVNAYSSLHMPANAATVNADMRNMLTFSAAVEHEYRGLNIGLNVNAYYDTDLKKTDLLFGFYMRFKGRFKLL